MSISDLELELKEEDLFGWSSFHELGVNHIIYECSLITHQTTGSI